MCGIIAALCKEPSKCINIIYEGLKYMQNRGYDSAGICSIIGDITNETPSLLLHKYASTDDNSALELLKIKLEQHKESYIGFGHTRWATHGAKTDVNSHPHTSYNGKFTVVHNGIIENYRELKNITNKKGYHNISETDTEVISNLLESIYDDMINNKEIDPETKTTSTRVTKIISKAQDMMNGSWGLVIYCSDTPENLYCVRRGSPLLIGQTDNEIIIASEQAGFGNRLNTYFILNSNDICILGHSKKDNLLTLKTSQTYSMKKTNKQLIRDSPAPYDHWTIREIHEQTVSATNAISMGGRVQSHSTVHLGGLHDHKEIFKNVDNIILLGCGTSYHSGFIAMNHFKNICDLNCVLLFDGAEFTDKDIPKLGNTVAIFISQSGETKDLHRCISIAKEHDIFTVGVVNVVDSLIAREVTCGVYLNAGTEVAVASTKSFTSQTIILTMIAIWIAQQKAIHLVKRQEYISDIHNLSLDIEKTLKTSMETIDNIVIDVFKNRSSCFLLGKGTGEGTAKEGSLKIKEITYVHTEGYSSSALKHGPFALLDKGFPVIMFIPSDEHFFKNQNAFQEVLSRGASVIVIRNTLENDDEDLLSTFESSVKQICVPYNNTFQSVINIIPIQILAYKLSVSKGINPDTPKNLAKVVTVE
jgi:glutamine---fructose-6-phosphate transaminase (isomerizing)